MAPVRWSQLDVSAVGTFIDDICTALTNSGILPENVTAMRADLQEIANIDPRASLRSNFVRIEKAIFNALSALFYAEPPIFLPEKGNCSIVLFLGQGAPKRGIAIKYAHYHRIRGYNVSLVCACNLTSVEHDDFNKGLKDAGISFYGRLYEKDAVKVALDGLQKFKQAEADMVVILADDGNLLVAEAVRADLTILTVDASVDPQAAHEEVINFRGNYLFGAVIMTNLTEANAGSLITAVSTAKLPLLYVDTAEAFQQFDSRSFVALLIGRKNKFIEIGTGEFHEILLRCEASQAEEATMMESVKDACTEIKVKQLAKYTLLCDEICASDSEYKDLCDQLGEEALKNSKIKGVNSIEDRRDCIVNSLKAVKYTKEERLQLLVPLRSRARDLSKILGEKNREQEYRFLSNVLPLEEALTANGISLSLKTIELAKKEINDLETRAPPKIFEKMVQLNKLLENEPYLTEHKDFELCLSKDEPAE